MESSLLTIPLFLCKMKKWYVPLLSHIILQSLNLTFFDVIKIQSSTERFFFFLQNYILFPPFYCTFAKDKSPMKIPFWGLDSLQHKGDKNIVPLPLHISNHNRTLSFSNFHFLFFISQKPRFYLAVTTAIIQIHQ